MTKIHHHGEVRRPKNKAIGIDKLHSGVSSAIRNLVAGGMQSAAQD